MAALDEATAYHFRRKSRKVPLRDCPHVIGQVEEREDGWYYQLQGFPDGLDEEPEPMSDNGPCTTRAGALSDLQDDMYEWFFENGVEQTTVTTDKRFRDNLAGFYRDEAERDEDEEEQ